MRPPTGKIVPWSAMACVTFQDDLAWPGLETERIIWKLSITASFVSADLSQPAPGTSQWPQRKQRTEMVASQGRKLRPVCGRKITENNKIPLGPLELALELREREVIKAP